MKKGKSYGEGYRFTGETYADLEIWTQIDGCHPVGQKGTMLIERESKLFYGFYKEDGEMEMLG